MTSGVSAKDSTLGTSGSESGVASNHAPLPRAPGNGTKRSRQASNGTNFQEAGIAETPETSAGGGAAESSHPAMSSSVRTLILGIDYDGRIVQHDRNAGKILGRKPERILFIDDRPENVAAAVDAGIRAIRFEGEEGLRKELVNLGVL